MLQDVYIQQETVLYIFGVCIGLGKGLRRLPPCKCLWILHFPSRNIFKKKKKKKEAVEFCSLEELQTVSLQERDKCWQ